MSFFSALNDKIYKIKTVVVVISHMMSPLAGMKQNQNQNLEAYTYIDMQRYAENSWYGISWLGPELFSSLLGSPGFSFAPVF